MNTFVPKPLEQKFKFRISVLKRPHCRLRFQCTAQNSKVYGDLALQTKRTQKIEKFCETSRVFLNGEKMLTFHTIISVGNLFSFKLISPGKNR